MLSAQSTSDGSTDFDTLPKDIVFQNDSQWEDNRWQASDVGPFLAGTIATGKNKTLKGLAVRLGSDGGGAICFDTARLRVSAAWTGDFLQFGPRRFGLIQPPQSAGTMFFETERMAGWAKDGRFRPTLAELTGPAEQDGWAVSQRSECRLPKDWCHYQGHYTVGERVLLSYRVGQTDVLEMPWYVNDGADQAFVRNLEIGPANDSMQCLVSGDDTVVTILGDQPHVTLAREGDVIRISPRSETIHVKLLITKRDVDRAQIRRLGELAGPPERLSQLIGKDDGRFRDVLTTKGETSSDDGAYVIDTLTLPFENPWKALLFTAGHDFFSDRSAAICTVHGDVWTVSGIDDDLRELRWRRFATGLCQPLGLKIVDDKVYVVGRNQITRLHDLNGDGEADFHENFNNDMLIDPRSHNFVTCLDTDPQGNFYFIHALTGVMRLTPDGSRLTSLADGFRNPNGMGVSPTGMITAAPQQGTWTPESSLIVVQEGGYYGFGGPRVTEDRPTGWDLPMCFIPRPMDNSGGGQVWAEGDRWGPLEGKMLHLSYGQCRMLLAIEEEVDGTFQGGTIQFPTTPGDFESGVMRGRFNPHDGQLYVSGLRGWQSRAVRDGCFQRVRYTGGDVHLPVTVKTFTNGIQLTFADPIDKETATNPDNYFAQQWNYLWSEQYGSPQFSVERPQEQGRDDVPVVSATMMKDGRTVFLEMPNRQIVNQISINWLLKSPKGEPIRGTFAHTINRQPTETFPQSAITRVQRPAIVPPKIVQRLRPGILQTFTSVADGSVDARVGRTMAIRQPIENHPTSSLPTGPFELQLSGTLSVDRSGLYDFKLEGSGHASLTINGKPIANSDASTQTQEPVLLRKGHNRISMSYQSPQAGVASTGLLWRGYDFAWEPVPPDALHYDSGDEQLQRSQRLREGRDLFADYRCVNCHQANADASLVSSPRQANPSLESVGRRVSREWLAHWLISPDQLRPGTHMPSVLGTGKDARQSAADIAAFLHRGKADAATDTVTTEDSVASLRGKAEQEHVSASKTNREGEERFETLGCIVCHHFDAPAPNDPQNRVSLFHVDAKYLDGALTQFLLNPTAHDAATEMPDFRLSTDEAFSLAQFVRASSKDASRKTQMEDLPTGDPKRGQALFVSSGCQQCHAAGDDFPMQPKRLPVDLMSPESGCLGANSLTASTSTRDKSPHYSLTSDQRQSIRSFLRQSDSHPLRFDPVETSMRLVKQLRCIHCHDRDGQSSLRPLVIAQEGSGRLPEPLPSLTRAGEKLQPEWTRKLLAGQITERSRPWLAARMPAFPAYAQTLAKGLALEHGVDPHALADHAFDPALAEIGEALTLQTGLDCRQCHAIGELQPRGDKDTKIALGINFAQIRERMRPDAYHRFMIDPPRYDINTRMIKLSENGLTTKLKDYFDASADAQFGAVWHYIQSLPRKER
tara:strand:+ start:66162 stop:70448 length:4287 start_codon:yes stop_codon:yes gene_type:complete